MQRENLKRGYTDFMPDPPSMELQEDNSTKRLTDSMARKISRAREINAKISSQDKILLDGILDGNLAMLPVEDRQNVARIFKTLDVSRSGSLEARDFHHDIPAAREALQVIWDVIRENFDFDGNDRIDPQEFLGYFVIHALFMVNTGNFPEGNLGTVLVEWQRRFLEIFRARVVEFERLVFNSGQQTSPAVAAGATSPV